MLTVSRVARSFWKTNDPQALADYAEPLGYMSLDLERSDELFRLWKPNAGSMSIRCSGYIRATGDAFDILSSL